MRNKFYSRKLKSYIKRCKLKNSYERLEVLNAIEMLNKHTNGVRFSVNDVYDAARRKRAAFSRATIYRALPLLVEAGILKDAGINDGRQLYILTPEHDNSGHLQCLRCGRTIEILDPAFEEIVNLICKDNNFERVSEYFCIKGICDKCKNFLRQNLGKPK
jgi:Fur family ferric uptake transcriptional regulator